LGLRVSIQQVSSLKPHQPTLSVVTHRSVLALHCIGFSGAGVQCRRTLRSLSGAAAGHPQWPNPSGMWEGLPSTARIPQERLVLGLEAVGFSSIADQPWLVARCLALMLQARCGHTPAGRNPALHLAKPCSRTAGCSPPWHRVLTLWSCPWPWCTWSRWGPATSTCQCKHGPAPSRWVNNARALSRAGSD
jgi:hypothetical protein